MKSSTKITNWISESRTRLNLAFLLLMVLPVAVFAYSTSRILKQKTENQTVTESGQIAQVSAALVEEYFYQSAAFLEAVAVDRGFRDAWTRRDMNEVSRRLQQMKALRSDFMFFSVYELDGTMRAIYPHDPDVLQENFSFRDWYKGVTRGWKPYVSEVYQTRVSPHQLVTAIAIPINNSNGNPIGILMAPFRVDTISKRLVERDPAGAWTIALIDHRGHLSAYPNMNSSSSAVDLSGFEPVKRLLAGGRGSGTFARDGTNYFVRYEPVGRYGWGVLIEQPEAALEAGAWALQRRVWLLGVVFVGLGLGFASLLRSLYSRLETGNRFLTLSIDMFCIAGFDGYFKYLNPCWETVLGFSVEELMSKPRFEFVHPEDRQATVAEVERLRNREVTLAFENRYLCRDGSYKWLLWNAVGVPDQPVIYAVARDISESKKVRQQIELQNRELEARNREVERATRLKSQFLASMSHELRTPLNAIVGFSGLLADKIAGSLNDKQARFVKHIRDGADHLLRLINDILDLSKIEAGQLEIHCEHFYVSDVLPEVLSTIRPLAMAKTIEVRQNLAAKQLVYADRIRFKQILYNLLSNAIKFTPNNGRVTVECIDLDGSVRISVIDTGIGIRPEDQQLIFEEFRQIEGEGAQAGTGLGLAITKRLIEQHRGRIWLESKLEEGSQFSFVLPAGSAVGSSSRTEPSATAICGADGLEEKPLVLIVDDEGPARELLINYFEPEGYRVAAASSFNETLEKAKRLRPTAITLDISMAGQDGFQILLELKCTPETAHIPIVVVSIVDNKKMGFALGAADYLVKPVDKAVLLETIRKHAQRGGYAENVILLVDDDPGALEMLEVMLRSSGYRTLTAANGKGALAMLSAVPVNAILVDLLMPEMNGFELIGQIKQDPNLQDIPIVVLSAKRLSEEEKSLLRRDTEAFFEKDGSWREQLIAEVRRSTKSKPVSLAERGA